MNRSRSDHIPRLLTLTVALVLAGALVSCGREERGFRVEPPAASRINATAMPTIQPSLPTSPGHVQNGYEENAYALAEGKRLFSAFNCVGCHAHGGGAIGPPLMDDQWIYGSAPEQIFATIVEGRPNGMPSFRGRIPDYQVWQLAAYVRSLAGLVPKSVAPGRNDDMRSRPPENSFDRQPPKDSSVPGASE